MAFDAGAVYGWLGVHAETANYQPFEAKVSRISLRALALFRIADVLWKIGRGLDRAGYVLHDKPAKIPMGFGDLANDLGGRVGARVERKAARG